MLRSAACRLRCERRRRKLSTSAELESLKDSVRARSLSLQRGVLGFSHSGSSSRDELLQRIAELEQHNPSRQPMRELALLDGTWRLVFTSKSLSARAKTKLGLRSLVHLGELEQHLDISRRRALTVVHFSAPSVYGRLTLHCSFDFASDTTVHVDFLEYSLQPEALRSALEKQRDVLLNSFSPEGSLHTTFLDHSLRISRDDSGFVHVLERPEAATETDLAHGAREYPSSEMLVFE